MSQSLFEIVSNLIRQEIELHPVRSLIDVVLLVLFVYMLFQKSYRIKERPERLTEKEMDELIEEWKPEPLVPRDEDAVDKHGRRFFSKEYNQPLVIQTAADAEIKIEGYDKPILNFAAFNFLGLANDKSTIEACKKAVSKYGVGACGPRGFYGTVDVHLEAEKRIAEFMGADECIIYSFGFCTVSSVIPAFSKRGDLLVYDENVGFAIQEGLNLSRSKTRPFKHNDMEDLERILKEIQEQDKRKGGNSDQRRYLVVQGVYENSGVISPLKKLLELKDKYKYRLIVDDSFGIGAIGKTGRGAVEYCDVDIKDIDIFTANMENAFGTIGGFCIGSNQVVEYQRLAGLGYTFSASLPPYISIAMIEALKRLQQKPALFQKLNSNIQFMSDRLSVALRLHNPPGSVIIQTSPVTPIFHMTLSPKLASTLSRKEQETILRSIRDKALASGVAIGLPLYSVREHKKPAPSLRVVISSVHTPQQIETAAETISRAVVLALE